MRRATEKINVAFYLGRKIGLSDAINLFYEQNGGFTPENFNKVALIRKEYITADNHLKQAEQILRASKRNGTPDGKCNI